MFKKIDFELDLVAPPFENLKYRDRTVLILIKNSEGKFLFGSKKFYPEEIKRMIGGGVDAGEEVLEGAVRELHEELGINVAEEDLQGLVEFGIVGKYKGEVFKTSIFTCYLYIDDQEHVAGDDVAEVVGFTEDECKKMANGMMKIDKNNMFEDKENSFSWADYGKVYGFVLKESLGEFKDRII